MTAITTYATNLLDKLTKQAQRMDHRGLWKAGAAGAAGFFLSAASVANRAMPLALGLLCASSPGTAAAAIAVGSCLGYLLFWGEAQAVVWMVLGLLAVALAGDTGVAQRQKLLLQKQW